MPELSPAKLVQIHIGESDRRQGRPLHEALVDRCRELGVAGATAIRGREGYGDAGGVGRAPVVVLVVDTAERIAAAMPELEALLDKAAIAVEDVLVKRVRR